jgi:hypothetical protein
MLTLLLANLLMLEIGKSMPSLSGEFLSGRKAVLPEAARGKPAMYLVGFSYESRYAVEAWAERFKKDFGANQGITFFEVPVIGGMGMLGKPFIDRGMRSGTPKQYHENVLTVYGGAGALRKAFGAKNDKHAVIVLCDREGLAQWTWQGMMDEAKYLEMKAVADRLLAK